MEQKISDDISNTSRPTKKPKLQPKGNLSPSDATSNNAATIAENLDLFILFIYLLYLTLVYKIVKNNSTNKYQQYQVKI